MKIATLLAASLATASAFAPLNVPQRSSSRLAAEEVAIKGAEAYSALTKEVSTVFTTEDIDKLLPHRYPFALVDKVIEYEAGKRAVGVKCVTKVRAVSGSNSSDTASSMIHPGTLGMI